MHVFMLAGEPSGEFHGAHLADALRTLAPGVTLTGVGGPCMRDAGVTLVKQSTDWGTIGIPAALRNIPRLALQAYQLVDYLTEAPPDVLVCIDFGAFNVRLLDMLHHRGWPRGMRAVYYIPPGSWSRYRTAGRLPQLVDAIATPFPWSAANLRAGGSRCHVEWVGHPVLDTLPTHVDRVAVRRALDLDPSSPVLALVPGSRQAELRHLLPTFVETVRRLTPQPACLVAVAPSLGEARVRALLPDDLEVRLLDGIDTAYIGAADAALVTSGTATLEIACAGVPMVVAYKGSWGDAVQGAILLALARLKQAPTYFSLPNIILDQPVVPEFFQRAANPQALADALVPLLVNSSARYAQLNAFSVLHHTLGDGHAALRTAALVCQVAGVPTATPLPPLEGRQEPAMV